MTRDKNAELLPCPFCGGPVELEQTVSSREWWGVVCRNTANRGGTCAIQQMPSASQDAAIERWNRRAPAAPVPQLDAVRKAAKSALDLLEYVKKAPSDAGFIDWQASEVEKELRAALSGETSLPRLPDAAPVQRAPLTDEQIDYLRGEANRGFDIEREHYFKAFRAIERAHGIKD